MRYLRYIVFFLVIYGLGLLGGYLYLKNRHKTIEPSFIYGVNMGAFGLNNIDDLYQPGNVDIQINLAKELGVQAVRVNLEVDKLAASPAPRDTVNDDLINRLSNAGLKILLVVEDPFQANKLFELGNRDNGWAWGYKIATRYKGKIYGYQLANEVSGMVIKENHAGRSMSDFDAQKYAVLKEWLTGLSQGIRDADPTAKRVVTAHWVATAIIDQLIADSVPFEVISWNWFSDMGDDPIHKTFDDGSPRGEAGTILDIPGHFAGKAKEFWFSELNRDHGSAGARGEFEQADYLAKAIKNIRQSQLVSAIFVYTLLDDPVAVNEANRHWGLVNVVSGANNKFAAGSKKAGFGTYQDIIKKNLSTGLTNNQL